MDDKSFARDDRVRKRAEYLFIQGGGRRFYAGFCLVIFMRKDAGPIRLGVTVSKKALKNSVDRNRFKRVVKEVFRLNRHKIEGAYDIVVIARNGVPKKLDFHWFQGEFDRFVNYLNSKKERPENKADG